MIGRMLRLMGRWRVTVRSRGTLAPPDEPGVSGLPEDDLERPAELTFDGDGQVFGFGGVNSVRGTWSVDGGALRFGPIVSTLMAGPPTAMRNETELLRLLGGPLALRLPGDGTDGAPEPFRGPDDAPAARVAALELVALDGDRLVLERVADGVGQG
jgi:heat shock protein HslJ